MRGEKCNMEVGVVRWSENEAVGLCDVHGVTAMLLLGHGEGVLYAWEYPNCEEDVLNSVPFGEASVCLYAPKKVHGEEDV